MNRRALLSTAGSALILSFSGCVTRSDPASEQETTVSSRSTKTDFAVDDLAFSNSGSSETRVAFTATSENAEHASETLILAPNDERTYSDLYPDGQRVTFEFVIDGERYTHESTAEQMDNRGVVVLIDGSSVDIFSIVH